jgi:hypothetical protein
MRDIAALVFGSEPAEPRALREPGPPREPSATPDARICDGQPAPSGDWCQTAPGDATLAWFALTLGARNRQHRP